MSKKKFTCKNNKQKNAIRAYYAQKAAKEKQTSQNSPQDLSPDKTKKELPKKFPFWARFRMSKQRTTLVIDETSVVNKKTNRLEDGYVHREATHTERQDYERIYPNPDKDDPNPMYLKRPRKHPKKLFEPHNKDLDMPERLRERYDKNNKKDK